MLTRTSGVVAISEMLAVGACCARAATGCVTIADKAMIPKELLDTLGRIQDNIAILNDTLTPLHQDQVRITHAIHVATFFVVLLIVVLFYWLSKIYRALTVRQFVD